MMREQPSVSVVIPTKNSETTLQRCLVSIRKQTYPNTEIIIVDSYSRDGTEKIAENCGVRIVESGAKRSEARNLGVNIARGEFVFFIDSDMELDSHVIEECVGKIKEGYDAIIIPEISVGEGFWAKCRALEKLCYVGDDLIEGTRFFKKSVFKALGGYDPQLEAGEDWDLSNRVRKASYRIARVKRFVMHHEGRLSLRDSVKKKQYYAKTIDRYIQKHPDLAKKQFRLLRPAFIKNWRKMVADPIHTVGLFGMKICEFVVGRLGLVKNKKGVENKLPADIDYAKRLLEDRKAYLINHFLPSGPYRFLDLGSGSGVYLSLLSKKGKQVVGLDVSHDLCKLSKSLDFDIIRGDAMHLPFRNKIFDGIWASEVLEHLSSLGVFDELERVTNLCIIATIPNPYSLNYKADSSHKLRYSISSLKAYLKTRKDWNYKVFGLGIEWPAAPMGIKLPKFVKLLTLYLTFYIPRLAPTICIIGQKKNHGAIRN